VVTSNFLPDCPPGKRRTLIPRSRVRTYERGLGIIPQRALSRRVNGPVTCLQQSVKSRVISVIPDCRCLNLMHGAARLPSDEAIAVHEFSRSLPHRTGAVVPPVSRADYHRARRCMPQKTGFRDTSGRWNAAPYSVCACGPPGQMNKVPVRLDAIRAADRGVGQSGAIMNKELRRT